MDLGFGIFFVLGGAILVFLAKRLARVNVGISKRYFGESDGSFYVWMYRVGGSFFCILGVLITTRIIESAEYK